MTVDISKEAHQNTDRELYRETEGDFYADSIHVTAQGGIGIAVGGTVYVKPLKDWHSQAARIAELEAASAWQLIRYEPARGETMQQVRGNFIGGELHEKGDAILVWLNQDDILMHEMNKPLPTHKKG